METINSTATPTPCYPREPTVRRAVQASQAQLAAISSSQSLDLELLTKEGDKVTLSIDARISALYAALGQVRTDEDDERYAQRGELSAGLYEREVSLTVEGDLSIAERREIRKVIKTINKMMKNFVAGKLEPVMAEAGRLQGLHTIDNLEVSMAFEHQLVVGQQALAAVSYGRSGETLTAPPAPARASGLPLKAESESLAEDMAQAAASAKAPADQLRVMADSLLKAYREQAARWSPLGGRIMDHIRNLFNAKMGW